MRWLNAMMFAQAQRREHAGKTNIYLAALDDRARQTAEGPSTGLIPCRAWNRVFVGYNLRNVSGLIGIAEDRVLTADTLLAVLAAIPPQYGGDQNLYWTDRG